MNERAKLIVMLEATLGGIRKHVVDMLMGIDLQVYQVTFVYSTVRADKSFMDAVPQLEKRGIAMVEIPMGREVRPFADVLSLVKTIRLFRNIRPDLVHLHGAKAGALGRIAARMLAIKRVVYTPHGGSFHKINGLGKWLYLTVEKLLVTRTLHMIGVSKESCNAIQRNVRIESEKVHCVQNGIDLSQIDLARATLRLTRSDIGLSDDHFVILYPALFLETKGHIQFLDVLSLSSGRLDDSIVVVSVGDGPLLSMVQNRIMEMNGESQFRLFGFRTDVFEFFNLADLVILPSSQEEFGYVLLEAMAFAKPILATNVGGIPEVVQQGYNGELFSISELNLMVERMNALSKNREAARVLGRNGRVAVEHKFNLETMICETTSIYQTLLHN